MRGSSARLAVPLAKGALSGLAACAPFGLVAFAFPHEHGARAAALWILAMLAAQTTMRIGEAAGDGFPDLRIPLPRLRLRWRRPRSVLDGRRPFCLVVPGVGTVFPERDDLVDASASGKD